MKITPYGFAVLDDDKDGLLSRWCEQGGRLDHDLAIEQRYTPLIPEGGWVVDAGAAIGDHTCAYLRKVGPHGVVFAFEPNPLMYECLAYNCPSAICARVGLADGFSDVSINHDTANAGGSHIVTGAGAYVMPLDVLGIPRLDFMKMDIEGMELLALHGAINTIKRCRPTVVLEQNLHALARYCATRDQLHGFFAGIGYSVSVFLGDEANSHCELIARP